MGATYEDNDDHDVGINFISFSFFSSSFGFNAHTFARMHLYLHIENTHTVFETIELKQAYTNGMHAKCFAAKNW